MSDDQWRAGFQSTPNFLDRTQALLGLNEVKREQTARGIERTFGRDVDVALM